MIDSVKKKAPCTMGHLLRSFKIISINCTWCCIIIQLGRNLTSNVMWWWGEIPSSWTDHTMVCSKVNEVKKKTFFFPQYETFNICRNICRCIIGWVAWFGGSLRTFVGDLVVYYISVYIQLRTKKIPPVSEIFFVLTISLSFLESEWKILYR